MNVMEAIAAWRSYRCNLVMLHLVAGSTYANQSAICLQLQDALGQHPLAELRKSHIELWMGKRLQTCSPVTVRGEMNVLRQIIRWCLDEGHLVAAPRFPKLAVPNVESALPSDAAFLWVLAHVPPQHAAALELMMLTGLSPHELERCQVRDFDDGVLSIGLRADFAVKQESRRRKVPLNARADTLWCQWAIGRRADHHPFPGVDAMQKAIRRATMPGPAPIGAAAITPKMMRKWFASKVAGEQPEHVLQRLMGHAPGSPITRQHYVRSTDAQSVDAVAVVGVGFTG